MFPYQNEMVNKEKMEKDKKPSNPTSKTYCNVDQSSMNSFAYKI